MLDVVAGIAHVIEKPPFDKGLLFLGQPFYLLGEIRNDEIEEGRRDSSNEALYASSWSSIHPRQSR